MNLSAIKTALKDLSTIAFQLPDGQLVPSHFHVTEIGIVRKKFIDCGGTLREEEVINFQLWNADDYDHRLHPEKLLHIIELSEKTLNLGDQAVEVEYQGARTIAKYDLAFDGTNFQLRAKLTDCLAKESCGFPKTRPKVNLKDLTDSSSCDPKSGCC